VAFTSYATDLVHPDTNGGTGDVFVHDRVSGATTIASVSSNGVQGNLGGDLPALSLDGRFVVFASSSDNLVPGDTNGFADIFVHDMVSGTTTRASVDSSGAQSNDDSLHPAISADGRFVAFWSFASNLVPGDTNGFADVFVHDMVNGSTARVSVDSNGVQGDHGSEEVSISGDGRYVAFVSVATNLVPGDTNGFADVFVHDMVSGTTTRVSVDSSGVQGNGNCGGVGYRPSISLDGRRVAFVSDAANLVLGDTNGMSDVFVHDMLSGITTRASVDSSGAQGDAGSFYSSLSADGRFVAFHSDATNLVLGDTNAGEDVFVHDMLSGVTTCASVDQNGAPGNGDSYSPSISADGRYVDFYSHATNLVPGDTNMTADTFVRDRGAASAFTSLCFGDGTGGACPCGNTGLPSHGCENSAATGGARAYGSGIASLAVDTVQLTSAGELANALSLVLQGSSVIASVSFGDGLRCAGGVLKRLYVEHAVGGMITVPRPGDPAISTRSATLGDPISLGATRAYQVYYRDPNLGFCSGGFNVTNAVAIAWGG
jgi:Tol biopolymer transport system component